MNRLVKLVALVIAVSIVLLSSCRSISREEAITITQDFVNSKVRFYVNENNQTPVIQRADISIVKTEKIDGNWYITVHVKSNQTGEIKQAVLNFVVDKNGQISGQKVYG